ncbi:MAG: Nucleotidyl transferase [Microgenomates group bacterium GW2011_GWA2_46_7]|nr:MAG: Nucleotidyl transferase [Microgenomates group bacterium GW2011_GWA2_46_7]KKU45897.1 MAG: Nucleotidyl transferase [Microgenomates group bacterium GW2011_GWC2_46_7]
MKYGSIPAGGLGTRLQPLGFSKELAPVQGRAVIEYLIERMVRSGIDKIFINTAPDKTDLIHYLSDKSPYHDHLIFLVRERKGLLDGITLPQQFLRPDDELYFGLPDTIWYPKDAYIQVAHQAGELVLGLFDTGTPERFDSVVIDHQHQIQSIEVKVQEPKTKWTWAIGKLTVRAARLLESNPLFGASLHTYSQAHRAFAVQLHGSSCLDIGIPEDYAKAEIFVKSHEQ